MALFPELPGWADTRKVKPIWILLKQETVSGSGISWAICKSAPHDRQITKPAPHRSNFLQAGCPSYRPTMSKHWRQNPNETPKPIHTKFGMGDYVCDITLHTENKRDQSSRVVWANGWNITLAWYFLVFFCDPNFCSHLKPNYTTNLYDAWFRGCQSLDIAFLVVYNYKNFLFSNTFTPKPTSWGHEQAFSSLTRKIMTLAYYQNYCIDSNQIIAQY